MTTQTELYRFSEQGSNLVWTFTSGNQVVTHNSEDYLPTAISRSTIESRNELVRANLDIKVTLTNAAALRWMSDNGENIVSLSLFERNRNGTVSTIWKGRLVSIIPGMTDIVLKFESIFTSLRRPGLRARYQKSCRHALYSRGCNLDPADFEIDVLLTELSGTVATIPLAASQTDGYYTGGMLRAPDGVLSYIISHVGERITLQRASFSLISAVDVGLPVSVKLYPGCNHSREVCNSKFNNLLNYGGFDFIPQKNPMGGSSIV